MIEVGPKEKALSNLKAHLKTPSHKKKQDAYLETLKQNKLTVDLDSAAKAREDVVAKIEKDFSGKFELLKLGSSCNKVRYIDCNKLISICPERGNVNHNLKEHLKSHPMKRITGQKRQLSMESFIKPSKVPKAAL